MRLLAELKRRKVIRVAGLYLVTAWLLIQVAETLLPAFGAPGWVLRALVLIMALGFVPALVVAWAFELTPDGLRRDRNADPASRVDGNRRLDIATIVVAVLAIGLLVADRLVPDGTADGAKATSAAAGADAARDLDADSTAGVDTAATGSATDAAPAADEQSVAVLAFVDMSPGKDSEYLGDGIAEEILNALARVEGLKVAGRTSSFSFKGKNEDLRSIGHALGVAHVLEGSVRRQGDEVRVTAQLVRTADGFHLWSDTYPGKLDDVFALQESIARAVAGELKVRLAGEQGERLVDAGTENAEAYALYLQASLIFHRRDGPRLPYAEELLKRALELDPKFARAWARMASIRSIARNYAIADPRQDTLAVEEAAHRAIALDPTLAEPYAAMGTQYGAVRDFVRMDAAFEKALAVDPDDVIANVWQGTSLVTIGYRRGGGNAALDRALALDPLLPIALLWRGTSHASDGELDIAEKQLRLADESGLAFAGLGLGQLAATRGDTEEAAKQFARGFQALAAQVPPATIAVFARACAGDASAKAEAIALADALIADNVEIAPAIAVYVLLRLGETERAFDVLEKGPTSNDALVFGSFHRAEFPGARTHPRFPELARRIGWAALWDTKGAPDDCAKRGDDWVCTQ